MILFTERPDFETAWAATTFRVVMAGMGDDTMMVIAEMYARGYEPDEIVFSDTRSEHKHTYKVIEYLKRWCAERNWSRVVVLENFDSEGRPLSCIEAAERDMSLPGAAFGLKSCTMRFKTEQANKYFNNHPDCWKAWGVSRKGTRLASHTGSILRIIGINADETHRIDNWTAEDKWCQVYPLVDWDIGERESKAIEEAGLYYPGKSSCICCPHMNGQELYNLKVMYPEDYERIKRLERNYQETHMKPNSSTIGMCRDQTIDQKIEEWTERGIKRGNGGCETCAIQ
jgi:3'-phosphoadenosine 5'-phosphosulfate sulfotransferase (PAPS reductase)/FAD synthetase